MTKEEDMKRDEGFVAATEADLRRFRKESRKYRRQEKRRLRLGERLGFRGWFYGKTYRATMRLAHRFNWHHARVIGPLAPASDDGRDYLRRCDWCGFTMRFNPNPRGPR